MEWTAYLALGVPPVKRMLIGGNWKCNGTIAEIDKIIRTLNLCGRIPLASEVVLAVPSIHIVSASKLLRKEIAVASEDVGINAGFGAYTGEVSAQMLLDVGVRWTLTGHSERRVGFGFAGETSEVVARKTSIAIKAGMSVILCIGEHLADREGGTTMNVCIAQLRPVVDLLSHEDWKHVVIAYEPVWAIGTGKVATPIQAEETHLEIRSWLAVNVSAVVAKEIRIIYGGSVNGANCKSLISCANIDGFLVGGASLKPEFVDIIKCTA